MIIDPECPISVSNHRYIIVSQPLDWRQPYVFFEIFKKDQIDKQFLTVFCLEEVILGDHVYRRFSLSQIVTSAELIYILN